MERAAMRTRRGFIRTAHAAGKINRALGEGVAKGAHLAGGALKGLAFTGAGLAAVGGAAAVQWGKYELAVARIGNLLPDTEDAVATLSDTIRGQSAALGIDPLEVAEGAYQAFSSGVETSTEALDRFLGVAGKASVAGGAELGVSVKALTAIVNTYRDAGLSASDVADKLFVTEALGVTNFSDIAENIGLIVSQAHELGVSLDDVLAPMASITKAGVNTGVAFTQLASVLSGIQAAEGKHLTFFEAAGLPTGAEGIKQVGGLQAYIGKIKELVDSGKTIEGKSGKDLIVAMFGRKEAQRALFRLTGSGFADMTRTVKALEKAGGTMDAKFANIEKRSGFRMRQMGAGFSQVVASVGRGLAEGLGLGAIDDIPGRIARASAGARSAARAFAEGLAEGFGRIGDFASVDWDAIAHSAGRMFGELTRGAMGFAAQLAKIAHNLHDVAEYFDAIPQMLFGVDEATAQAAGGRPALIAREEAEKDSARNFNALVDQGIARPMAPWELARRMGSGGRVGGEIKVTVTAEGGARVTSASATSTDARVPITVDTGSSGAGVTP